MGSSRLLPYATHTLCGVVPDSFPQSLTGSALELKDYHLKMCCAVSLDLDLLAAAPSDSESDGGVERPEEKDQKEEPSDAHDTLDFEETAGGQAAKRGSMVGDKKREAADSDDEHLGANFVGAQEDEAHGSLLGDLMVRRV